MTKSCRRCGATKPRHEFKPNPKISDGLSSWCRSCHVEATRRWREEHPERVAAYNAERRREVVKVRCPSCGQVFERPSRARSIYCTTDCLVEARKRRRRAAA